MNEDVVALGQVFTLIIAFLGALTGMGIATHAYVQRAKRARAAPPRIDDDRLQHLEHAVDAIAIEVERLGEGQRFVTKLLADRAPMLGEAAPMPRERLVTPH